MNCRWILDAFTAGCSQRAWRPLLGLDHRMHTREGRRVVLFVPGYEDAGARVARSDAGDEGQPAGKGP
jgi:hypothetical protein